MTDAELIARLREGATWDDDVAAADRIEALTEQLEAARADAKEAEAYAEELERDLKTCRMAQVVMENGIAEAEKERDDYAFKLADANNTYGEMHVALIEANDKLATCEKYRDAYAECDKIGTQAVRDLEAKLAKAEAGLLAIAKRDEQMIWGEDYEVEEAFKDMRDIALATLAEIKGESHE
jgi:chromosome segregation ATPase